MAHYSSKNISKLFVNKYLELVNEILLQYNQGYTKSQLMYLQQELVKDKKELEGEK